MFQAVCMSVCEWACVCMCVCVHVCVGVHVYVCVYAYVYEYVNVREDRTPQNSQHKFRFSLIISSTSLKS